ncbi:MAG: hypothetical protein AAF402_13765 [Pseudomonadota bacterium]
MADTALVPLTISESVKVEIALHHFYKVIETIYGGALPRMPQGNERLLQKFEKIGIDLNEVVGFPHENAHEEPIIDKISKLRGARDERAAHGGAKLDRKSTYYELIDAQEMSRYLLLKASWNLIGFDRLMPVRDRGNTS